ncbi:MAG: hypothetical protein MUD14_21675 [Hydrococcus sp. Prado102]|jgi:hypothetical protein|nr:hypothetical protein [Hydrococcus sp. Prado102]
MSTQNLKKLQKIAKKVGELKVRNLFWCDVEWEEMQEVEGKENVRKCEQCQEFVYDLRGLTDEQIKSFLIEYQGQMCGQFWLRSDGTVTGKACGEQPLRGRIAITRD